MPFIIQLLVGVLLGVTMAVGGYSRRALSRSGAVAAAVVEQQRVRRAATGFRPAAGLLPARQLRREPAPAPRQRKNGTAPIVGSSMPIRRRL